MPRTHIYLITSLSIFLHGQVLFSPAYVRTFNRDRLGGQATAAKTTGCTASRHPHPVEDVQTANTGLKGPRLFRASWTVGFF